MSKGGSFFKVVYEDFRARVFGLRFYFFKIWVWNGGILVEFEIMSFREELGFRGRVLGLLIGEVRFVVVRSFGRCFVFGGRGRGDYLDFYLY